MKVLLVNPPHALSAHNPLASSGLSLPPLGLLYIAAFLRKEMPAAELKVIDWPGRRLSAAAFEEELAAFEPDLAGITVYTGAFTSAMKVSESIKKLCPACFTVAGGHHAAARPGQCLEKGAFDAVVAGEGERVFAELALKLEKGETLAVPGLTLKKDPGPTIQKYPPLNLDTLPMPARDLLDLKLYRPAVFGYKRSPVTSMVTSRGCPFSCKFCSKTVFGSIYRAQSPENTLEEILRLMENYGIREISFQDDTFTFDRKRVMDLCGLMIDRGLDLTWSCMTRVDLVDAGLLEKMKESGCVSIAFGIDGADDGACGLMNKGFSADKARSAVAAAKKAGIETRGYYIFGYPGETLKSMEAALENIMDIGTDHVFFAFAHPFFDTGLYAEAREKGLLKATDEELCDSYDNTQPLITVPGASPEELIRFYKKAYLRYYLRPGPLFNRITSLRSAGDLAGQFRAFRSFLKWR